MKFIGLLVSSFVVLRTVSTSIFSKISREPYLAGSCKGEQHLRGISRQYDPGIPRLAINLCIAISA